MHVAARINRVEVFGMLDTGATNKTLYFYEGDDQVKVEGD